MSSAHIRLFITALILVFCASGQLSAKTDTGSGVYTQKDKEFYLTPEQLLFIRPGLVFVIEDVVIPADMLPEVTFSLSDPAGLPLDREGVTTPGPVSTSFIYAYIPEGKTTYVAYTTRVQTSPITGDSAVQATSDSGGTYTALGDGRYIYKFGTPVPEGYELDATHSMGGYARRDLREFDLDRYVDNFVFHHVPSGVATPVPRDIVTTETCNGRCHDPLAIHGGSRQKVELCILCHNATQDIDPDTGNSIYMPLMTHKIHAGVHLTQDYTIIGYRQGVHNYNHVEYPAPLNDCEVCHTGGVPMSVPVPVSDPADGDMPYVFPLVNDPDPVPVCDQSGVGQTTRTWNYPQPVRIRLNSVDGPLMSRGKMGTAETGKWVNNDTTFFVLDDTTGEVLQEQPVHTTVLGCSGNAPGTFRGVAATQHTAWMTNPTVVHCGSCHDYVNFETGENHSQFEFPVTESENCRFCHKPTSGVEYDRTVKEAHTVEYKSEQLPGVLVDILSVDNTGPGEFPMVTFSLSNKFGPMDPADLDRIRFSIAGPNTDFVTYWNETATDSLVPGPMEAGHHPTWMYMFEDPLPMDATGSWTLGVEGRAEVLVNEGTDKEFETEDQMQNFNTAFAVTDEEPVARRMIVDDAKCENCHSNLSLHGSNRHNAQYCTTCHFPAATDIAVRSEDNMPPQSINFKYMIHKIHRGADLENGYVVLGYRSSVHDFSHVEYPGDLRNCDACHVNGSQYLPLPAGLENAVTPYDPLTTMPPVTAACLSCHDGLSAAGHADLNLSTFGETCETCHAEGRSAAVSKLHAR